MLLMHCERIDEPIFEFCVTEIVAGKSYLYTGWSNVARLTCDVASSGFSGKPCSVMGIKSVRDDSSIFQISSGTMSAKMYHTQKCACSENDSLQLKSSTNRT